MTYPTIRPELTLDFANSRQLDPRITFSRSSGATYLNPDTGLITLASDHEARIEKEGLLIEEARTNTMVNSDLSGLTDYEVITQASTEINPEGVASCKKITATLGGNQTGHRRVITGSPTASDTTMSVFVKMDTHPYVLIGSGGQSHGYTAAFNIDPAFTGDRLLGQDGKGTRTNIGAGYESYSNGWFRIWASGNTTGSDGWSLALSPDADTHRVTNWSAAGTEAIFAHGCQAEVGVGFPSSYIPTAGSTVTRSADVCTITGDNFSSWYNASAGTFYVQQDSINNALDKFYIFVSNGANNDRLWMSKDSTNRHVFRVYDSTNALKVVSTSPTLTSSSGLVSSKFVGAYFSGDSNSALDGDIVGAGTNNAFVRSGSNSVYLGSTAPGSSLLNGHISRLTYYSRRLTDSDLQSITL